MQLIEINPFGLQPFQGCLAGMEDMIRRKIVAIGSIGGGIARLSNPRLGGNKNFFANGFISPQPSAKHPLAQAITINIGVIKKSVSSVIGGADGFVRVLFALGRDLDRFAAGNDSPATVSQPADMSNHCFSVGPGACNKVANKTGVRKAKNAATTWRRTFGSPFGPGRGRSAGVCGSTAAS